MSADVPHPNADNQHNTKTQKHKNTKTKTTKNKKQ